MRMARRQLGACFANGKLRLFQARGLLIHHCQKRRLRCREPRAVADTMQLARRHQ